MTQDLYNFRKKFLILSSKIENKISASQVLMPSELIYFIDKEYHFKYRAINGIEIYDLSILDKYQDKILGHAIHPSTGVDVILIQYDKYNHIQMCPATHPLDESKVGLKAVFLTKGGEVYENFLKENEELEEKVNERRTGFNVG